MDNAAFKRTVLFVSSTSSFLTPFMGSSINIALPAIGKEFAMDAVSLSWIATAYLLAAAMFLVPFGRIADIYGRKRVFLSGMVINTASFLLCALSPSATLLIIFRIVQGIGGGMIFGTSVAILTSAYPTGERGKALGINAASVYLGLSAGPFFGGFLTQHFGWRSIFIVSIPLGLIIIMFIIWKLREEWADAKGEKFDFTGSAIYSLALVAVMYGFSRLPAVDGYLLIVIGIAGIALFGIWEAWTQSPVLDVTLFRSNRIFLFSSLAALINYSATFAVGFLLSLYLQYIKGFSPRDAGFILMAQPVMQAAFSPLAGWLSDRIQPRLVASMGMGLTVLGLLPFAFLGQATSLVFIIASLVVLGGGFALFSSPITNAVMGSVERKLYGVASGILGTMRLIGQMFSMGIAMLVISIYVGKVQITPRYYSPFIISVKTIFIILTILCCAGVFASLARGKAQQDRKAQ